MIDAFVEGVRSLGQACHLVITLPAALTIIAARGRWQAVTGAVFGVLLGGWIFTTNSIGAISDLQLRSSAVIVGAAVVAIGFPTVFDRNRPRWLRSAGERITSPVGVSASAGAIAVIVVQWWRPCVGVALGSILTDAPGDPWGQLPATVGFMLGISVPLIVTGLVYAAGKPAHALSERAGWVGSGVTVVLALSVVAGQHGEIVSRLFQWSQ